MSLQKPARRTMNFLDGLLFFAILSVILILVGSALLQGCASAPPRAAVADVQIKTVTQLVAKPCATDAGPAPIYVDNRKALNDAANIYERAKLMAAGQAQRIAREIQLTSANSGCKPPETK
jgi:hypothetical protein